MPQFSFCLLGSQIIPVVHVLMLPQVSRDLSHFSVELYVDVFLLSEHDSMLQMEMQQNDHLTVARLEKSVLYIVVEDVDFVSSDACVAEPVCVSLDHAWNGTKIKYRN